MLILAWLASTTPALPAPGGIEPARDLAQETRDGAGSGRAMLILFPEKTCPFCERAKREFAEPMVGFNGPDFYGAYLDGRIDAAVKRIRRP